MKAELKEAKKTQRNAKAALTRCEKKLTSLLDDGRPEGEVRDALNEVKEAYGVPKQREENSANTSIIRFCIRVMRSEQE